MLELLKPSTEGSEELEASSSTPEQRGNSWREVVKEDVLQENFLSCNRCGEILWKNVPEERKVLSVAIPEEVTMCSLIIRKRPISKSARGREQHEPGVASNLRSEQTGDITQIWRLDHGR